MATVEEQIQDLESKISELKRKPKDAWDRASIVFAGLMPFAIAFIGWIVASKTQQAQDYFAHEKHLYEVGRDQRDLAYKTEQDKRLLAFQKDKETREAGSSGVADTLKLVEALSSPTPAISAAAKHQLETVNPNVLAVVLAEIPPSSKALAADAAKVAAENRSRLAKSLNSPERSTRIEAFSQVRLHFTDDAAVLAAILEESPRHQTDPNRVYSTAAILNWFSSAALRQNRTAVQRFIASVPAESEEWRKTNELVREISKRL